MKRSHLYILLFVLGCALSAIAASTPEGDDADVFTHNISADSVDIDSTPVPRRDRHRDRTLLSDIDSDSVAAAELMPIAPPHKAQIVMKQVDLGNEVNFSAKDSMVLIGRRSAYMYGDARLTYGNLKLSAAKVSMDMSTTNVKAIGERDSVGELQGMPVFSDPSGEYESETMDYNFKTQRGFITNVVTEQGEGYLTGGQTKKMENGEYYLKNGRYSTCSNHENPHFYFQITKGKMKPKSNIVTGPAYMVLAGLPLPIALPFGYFPFSEKYSSGIIFPTFGDDNQRGFYAGNGGYYFAINDNVDLALTGELYTKGSWGLSARSNYVKRYKYSGSFNLSYLTTIQGEKGGADYSKQTNFQVLWSHQQDSKANPNMNLSASVNFATSGYSRNDLNSYYGNAFTENTKSSTVNLTYRIPNTKWSLSSSLNISQRTQDSTLSVSFPNLSANYPQFQPFKRKRAVGRERWYEKIKMSYSGLFQNSLTAKQDQFLQKSLVRDWRNAMRHSVPISATFNALKYINITPSVGLTDRMYTQRVDRRWDPSLMREMMDTTYGFYNVWDFNVSLTMDTKLYGFYQPLPFLGNKVKMIRHVVTPTIALSGNPDFGSDFFGYYGQYAYKNSTGEMIAKKYSRYPNAIFGVPSEGRNGSLSLSLANNLEMKVKTNDSIGEKKVSLIENLSLSQSYNMAVDSMRWSDINSSIMIRLMKNFNLNLSGVWDVYTYQLNSAGNPVRVDIPRWKVGKGIGRLRSTGTSFSYTLNNDTFKKKSSGSSSSTSTDTDSLNDDNQDTADTGQSTTTASTSINDNDGYMPWDVPWSLTFNYSVNYGYGAFNKRTMEYDPRLTQNLSFSGNLQPTKGWSFGFSASYNFDTGRIAYMNCNVSRDLHCFTMTANIIPVGPYKSYNFHIAIKSSLLQDVKYDKRSNPRDAVEWY